MITKIKKGPVGALDIAFDVSGSNEKFNFVGSDGKFYPNEKVNAAHIPVSQAVRYKLFANNVDAAIQALIEHFSDESSATETIAGIARIATQTETNDGIADNLIVTPKKLKALVATAALAGLVKLATAADLTNNTNPNSVLTVSLAQNLGGLPAGIGPFPWYFPTVPSGYVKADGTLYSRTIFAELWNACKGTAITDQAWSAGQYTAFSAGDGATTFRVPDLRGLFMRGVDGGTKHDPDAASRTGGDKPGSLQQDAIRNITGTATMWTVVREVTGAYGIGERYGKHAGDDDGKGSTLTFDASKSVPTGGDNRPKNFSVHWIFKV